VSIVSRLTMEDHRACGASLYATRAHVQQTFFIAQEFLTKKRLRSAFASCQRSIESLRCKLDGLMCRDFVSVDYRGVYYGQALELGTVVTSGKRFMTDADHYQCAENLTTAARHTRDLSSVLSGHSPVAMLDHAIAITWKIQKVATRLNTDPRNPWTDLTTAYDAVFEVAV